jgi:hypothetical protein
MYHYELVQEIPIVPMKPMLVNLPGCMSHGIQESTWDHERGALVELRAIDLQIACSKEFENSQKKDLKDGGWKLASKEEYPSMKLNLGPAPAPLPRLS